MADFQGLLGTLTARNQRIVNFDSFIFSHVPYGRVDPDGGIQVGLIEYDGPNADLGLVSKPMLAWNFGGIAYPITKAARVEYTYQSEYGSGVASRASMLLGFQSGLAEQKLKPSPRITPINDGAIGVAIDRVGGQPLGAELSRALAAGANNVVTGSPSGFATLDQLIDAELLPELAALARARSAAAAAEVRAQRDNAAGNKLQGNVAPKRAEAPDKDDLQLKVTRAQAEVDAAMKLWAELKREPVIVAFDGPARDNTSLNPFGYTLPTLFNDKEKYSQLLWWYFGGKPYRITKAIRIPDRSVWNRDLAGEDVTSVFVGFAGPGSDPGA
jgi:hypothetical protein